ncbi:MAG: hypothetical protein WCR42_02830 [bacterium]
MIKSPKYYVYKVLDLFMFREGTDEDNHSLKPKVTFGSIVWGVLLRTVIVVGVILLLLDYFHYDVNVWLIIFAIWLLAAYPAYKQYNKFNQRMKKFKEETLCGSCKYFNRDAQLCSIYDEHVSEEYIPCEGESWEPKPYLDDDED